MNEEIYKALSIFVSKTSIKWHTRKITNEHKNFLSLLYPSYSLKQQIWLFRNNYESEPYCPVCSKVKPSVYMKTCSKECSVKNVDYAKSKEKATATKLEKYGDENYNNRSKAKKTKLEKYGEENYNNSDKNKATKLEKYNNEFYTNREKAKRTNLEKYGAESYFSTDIFKSDIEEYWQKTLGVSNPAQSISIIEKIKHTMNNRYGGHFNQQHISEEVLLKLNNKKWLIEQHHMLKRPLIDIAKELNVNDKTVCNYCKKYNIEVKLHKQSYPEKQLAEYIEKTYNTNVIRNNRTIVKPKEIDIYLPEYNLAIEYNGIYWHNPSRYGSKLQWFLYHQNKEELCNLQRIQLLHLWEDYLDHNDLIDKAINGGVINNNLNKVLSEVKWA